MPSTTRVAGRASLNGVRLIETNQPSSLSPTDGAGKGKEKQRKESTDSRSPVPANIFSLEWRNLGYTVTLNKKTKKQKTLIKEMNGSISSAQVTAILGPSGCGKTTLLNVLTGRIDGGELTGQVHFEERLRNPETWNSECAYVEQHDIYHPHLTVEETITFAANFRLPYTMSNEQKLHKIERLIMELGLNSCRAVAIGEAGGGGHGISGGERKRLSIAIELLTSPRVLILDEPTSGLDSFTSLNVIQTLKELAKKRNMIVLLTIHQPRTSILSIFDQLILCTDGRCVYMGKTINSLPYFESMGYKLAAETNPADYFLDHISLDQRSPKLIEASKEKIAKLLEYWATASENKKNITPLVANYNDNGEVRVSVDSPMPVINAPQEKKVKPKFQASLKVEFLALLNRSLISVKRDQSTMKAVCVSAIISLIILSCLVYGAGTDPYGTQTKLGIFFSLSVYTLMRSMNSMVPLFHVEKLISRKERASNSYRVTTAFFAKWLAQFPMFLLGNCLFCVPLYFVINYDPNTGKFFSFLVGVCVQSLAGSALGIWVAAITSSIAVGQVITPLLTILACLFAGETINFTQMPAALGWMRWLSPTGNSCSFFAANQFQNAALTCPSGFTGCYSNGNVVLSTFGYDVVNKWYYIVCNVALSVVLAFFAVRAFDRQSKPLMKLS